MTNEIRQDRPADARFYACPSTIEAGDPVLIGGILPAVALDDYDAALGGTTFRIAGTFLLSVRAISDHSSPPTGSAITQGQQLYASGTLDATTGVVYDLLIDKTSAGAKFGTLDQTTSVSSGQTADANVKLRETAS